MRLTSHSFFMLLLAGTFLDNQPGILDHGEMVQTLDNAVRDNPGTTFIACHYANCSDMGTAPEMYRTTFRILASEDEHFYDHDISSYHWPMNGYGLPDGVLEKPNTIRSIRA